MQSIAGCSSWLRRITAVAALVVGVLFIRQSFSYHRAIDALVRIPFVFGALIIGLLMIGVGIRLLFPKL